MGHQGPLLMCANGDAALASDAGMNVLNQGQRTNEMTSEVLAGLLAGMNEEQKQPSSAPRLHIS